MNELAGKSAGNQPEEPNQRCVSRRIAYHEAGHAVVAHALELDLLSVSIEVHANEFGVVRRGHCACNPSPRDQDNATVHMAASVAVYLLTGRGEPIDEDTLKVVGIGHARFGDDQAKIGSFIDEMQRRARDILERQWPAVQALADALLIQRTVDGRRAAEIIERAQNVFDITPHVPRDDGTCAKGD